MTTSQYQVAVRSKRYLRLLLSLTVTIALAGCGGGGQSIDNSTPSGGTPPPSVPTPTPNPNPTPAADASLSLLDLSVGELDQPFQSSRTAYTATVGYLDNTVQLELETSDPAAVIRINGTTVTSGKSERIGLAEGQNDIAITVENGSTQANYSVELTRQTQESFGQSAYIKASNPGAGNVFGTVLAFSGDTLVVGAPYEDSGARGVNDDPLNGSASNSGAAYVFVRDGAGTWNQQAYLKASNADPNDNFGYSVAISGDVLAIGAPQESSNAVGLNGDQANNSMFAAGAVYIFVRDSGGQWSQQAYVKPANTTAGGAFGGALALDGDTVVVGAKNMPQLVGSAHVFTQDTSGSWSAQAVLTASDAAADAGFAQELALDGDTLVVGSPFHGGIPSFRGAAYVFTRENGNWSEVARLQGSNTEANDNFGRSVALSGNTLAVGAPGEDSGSIGIGGNQNDNSANASGAVYVFERDQVGSWNQTSYIKASNTDALDGFGYAVSLSGDWLAVTAENEAGGATGIGGTESDNSEPGAGAGFLFVRNLTGAWSQELYVKPAISGANDRFGRSSAALSDSTLIFAAPFEDSNATGVNGDASNNSLSDSGAVYVFE